MKISQLQLMFSQSAIWTEIVDATSSLKAETTKEHNLSRVRISRSNDGRALNKDGESTANSSTLYILDGYSLCDAESELPAIKTGDEVTTASGQTMVVAEIRKLYGVTGSLHHLEIILQ